MNSMDQFSNVIETDVLIIGGGYAGLWSAIRAKQNTGRVLVVEKGPPMGLAGQAFFSGGGIEAAPPHADPADHVKDVMCLGDGLFEQDLLENIFKQSWDRILEFERLGVEFLKEKDGSHWAIPQRGLNHLLCYLGKPFGSGGEDMMRALTTEASRLGVDYMNRVLVTDLLKSHGTVVGAVGFNTRSGEFYVFKAGAVIVATGECAMKGHYEDIVMSCGSGMDIAFRAGAEMKNTEFATIWVIPRNFRWEGITYLLPLGARFVDAKGEPFIEKYSPVLKSNIDYNYLVRFMAMEGKKGNGPFYLDCSQMTPYNKERMTPSGGWTELQYKRLLEDGIRTFEQRQEWCGGVWSMGGGLHSDLNMQTKVPGLFVAGKSRNVNPGIYFGGWSLCLGAATGCWAGENAARFAGENRGKVDPGEVKRLKKDLYAPLQNGSCRPDDVLLDVQNAVFPGEVSILKTGKKLQEALAKVEAIRNEAVPNMSAREIRDLLRLRETKSIALFAELFLRGSLLRTETRASHYREDFPKRDDQNWLKWIFVSQVEGKLQPRFEPVPLSSYKHKADRFYMDNFKF